MTDDRPPDDPDRERTTDEDGPEGSGNGHDSDREGLSAGEWLTTLLQSLERFERLSGRGRGRGQTALDFDVSIGTGIDAIDGTRSRGQRSGRPPSSPRHDGESLSHRPRDRHGETRSYRRSEPTNDHNVTARTYEDELIVTADVAGVAREDVTVGFDGGTLVVSVDGRELERVDVPWEDRTAEATVRNGILTVRVTYDTHD